MRKNDLIDFESKYLLGNNNHLINKNQQDNEEKELVKSSEDWKYVDFLLKSSISTEASITRLLSINNQNMKIKFDKLSEGKVTINAWVNMNQVGDSNFYKKIKLNGFDISPNGMDFWTGSISEDTTEEGIQETDNVYILCKIIVGRAFIKILKNKGDINNLDPTKSVRPEGYDSVLFWIKENNSEKSTQFTPLKCYKYRIYESELVLPNYFVFFGMKDSLNSISAIRICDECNALPATIYCVDCDAELCEDDYNSIHSPDNKPLFNFHNKLKIEKNRPGQCDCENKYQAEYYCEDCNKTICSYCKILGSHSKGLALEHNLIEINFEWKNRSPENNQLFPNLEQLRKKAHDFLSKINESTKYMRNHILLEAKNELETEFKKEFNYAVNTSKKLISDDIQIINQLVILKSTVTWISEYFYERENFFKENKNNREVIWIWGFHLQFVNNHMSNIIKIDNAYADLKKVSFINRELNKFGLIKLYLDEDYSDMNNNKEDTFVHTSKRNNRLSIVNNKVIMFVNGNYYMEEENKNKPSQIMNVKHLKGRPSLEGANNKNIIKLIGEVLIKNADKSLQQD